MDDLAADDFGRPSTWHNGPKTGSGPVAVCERGPARRRLFFGWGCEERSSSTSRCVYGDHVQPAAPSGPAAGQGQSGRPGCSSRGSPRMLQRRAELRAMILLGSMRAGQRRVSELPISRGGSGQGYAHVPEAENRDRAAVGPMAGDGRGVRAVLAKRKAAETEADRGPRLHHEATGIGTSDFRTAGSRVRTVAF